MRAYDSGDFGVLEKIAPDLIAMLFNRGIAALASS
jgi:hypothetical protein